MTLGSVEQAERQSNKLRLKVVDGMGLRLWNRGDYRYDDVNGGLNRPDRRSTPREEAVEDLGVCWSHRWVRMNETFGRQGTVEHTVDHRFGG